jgi:hypothetical protein
MKCRVTGRELEKPEGRGRPSEYVNDDARNLMARMNEVSALFDRVLPLMDDEHVREWRGRFFSLAARSNKRIAGKPRAAKVTT